MCQVPEPARAHIIISIENDILSAVHKLSDFVPYLQHAHILHLVLRLAALDPAQILKMTIKTVFVELVIVQPIAQETPIINSELVAELKALGEVQGIVEDQENKLEIFERLSVSIVNLVNSLGNLSSSEKLDRDFPVSLHILVCDNSDPSFPNNLIVKTFPISSIESVKTDKLGHVFLQLKNIGGSSTEIQIPDNKLYMQVKEQPIVKNPYTGWNDEEMSGLRLQFLDSPFVDTEAANIDSVERMIKMANMPKGEFFAKYFAILQSSGTGKSRLAIELLKRKHWGILSVFRAPLENPKAIPKTNPWSEDYLARLSGPQDIEPMVELSNKMLCRFAKTLLEFMRLLHSESVFSNIMDKRRFFLRLQMYAETLSKEEVLALKPERMEHFATPLLVTPAPPGHEDGEYVDFGSAANAVVIRRLYRHLLYFLLTDEAVPRPAVFGGDANLGKATNGVQKLTDVYEFWKSLANEFPGETFVLVFDEVAHLLSRIMEHRKFRALRRVLQKLSSLKVVSIFLGTTTSGVDLYSSAMFDSARKGDGHKIQIPLIYLGSFQIFAMMPARLADMLAENLATQADVQFTRLSMYGRCLWKDMNSNDQALQVAIDKLLDLTWNVDLSLLAAIACRTAIEINPASFDAHELVRSRMALLVNMNVRHGIVSVRCEYPCEPLLAIASKGVVFCDRYLFRQALQVLQAKILLSVVSAGHIGELAARLLLLRCIDVCQIARPSVSPVSTPEARQEQAQASEVDAKYFATTVGEWLRTMLVAGTAERRTAVAQQVENILNAMDPDLRDATINYTHFVQLYKAFNDDETPADEMDPYPKNPPTQNGKSFVIGRTRLEWAFASTSAFITVLNMPGIDFVIPILKKKRRNTEAAATSSMEMEGIEETNDDREYQISCIGIQIKNWDSTVPFSGLVEMGIKARLNFHKEFQPELLLCLSLREPLPTRGSFTTGISFKHYSAVEVNNAIGGMQSSRDDSTPLVQLGVNAVPLTLVKVAGLLSFKHLLFNDDAILALMDDLISPQVNPRNLFKTPEWWGDFAKPKEDSIESIQKEQDDHYTRLTLFQTPKSTSSRMRTYVERLATLRIDHIIERFRGTAPIERTTSSTDIDEQPTENVAMED
ncbi:MAG: hypothetical protein KBD29_03985 [Candidatus Magasanikbacteria bacterium]|nr:hypothetical protein [Candidatus Magasanikbacteria bacterium]